ncbi:hypothetical protein ACQ4ED_004164 [Escherichia coli]
MDSLLAILGGVGLGAILKSIVDYFLNKKSGGNKTQYAETCDAYIGIILALHKISVIKNHETSKDFGLAHMKVKLFGSDKVASLISEAVYTDDEARKNEILEKDMIDAMKDDLRSKRT